MVSETHDEVDAIRTSSRMAFFFSQGDAFISQPERTITLTSSPPRAGAIHRGIASPEHDHALADRCTWPKETLYSQSMPIWMLAAASLRPGIRARGRAARPSRRRPLLQFGEQLLQALKYDDRL